MSLIQADKLTKVYGTGDTAVVALDHVDLTVNPGEFVAVMGPSGCGKSTLLHLLGGLDRPSEGTSALTGSRSPKCPTMRSRSCAAAKSDSFFSSSTSFRFCRRSKMCRSPCSLDGANSAKAKQKATEWLTKVGLEHRLASRPDQLSAGQQQRVAIARALITDPVLVLADEPTGNLDTKSADEIAALLKQVAKTWGRAVLMVTHDPRIAAYADRIVFLKDGKIVNETHLANGGDGAKQPAGQESSQTLAVSM